MRMPMGMAHHGVVAISAALGFKRGLHVGDDHVHGAQQFSQHMIGLDLQMVGLKLDRHVTVAQVIGGAHHIEGTAMLRARRDVQHSLGGCLHTDERSVFGHQHIAPTNHRAARQEDAQRSTQAVRGVKAAFLARVPVQRDGGGTLHQHASQPFALRHALRTNQHQNKK